MENVGVQTTVFPRHEVYRIEKTAFANTYAPVHAETTAEKTTKKTSSAKMTSAKTASAEDEPGEGTEGTDAPAKKKPGLFTRPRGGGRGGQRQAGSQTLEVLFSAVSTPIFASKYSFESS